MTTKVSQNMLDGTDKLPEVDSLNDTDMVRIYRDGTNYRTSVESLKGHGLVNSVNGQTGNVTLDASDVGALPDTYVPPAPPVISVNGQDGAVVLTAEDVGALPDTYVPPLAPVQSVNGQTGEVSLSASDVGALPDTYTPPAAPVQSVNGQTGAVELNASDVGAVDLTSEQTITGVKVFPGTSIASSTLRLGTGSGQAAITLGGGQALAFRDIVNNGLYGFLHSPAAEGLTSAASIVTRERGDERYVQQTDDYVQTVNGQTGTVTITAEDIGASEFYTGTANAEIDLPVGSIVLAHRGATGATARNQNVNVYLRDGQITGGLWGYTITSDEGTEQLVGQWRNRGAINFDGRQGLNEVDAILVQRVS